jgi:hypothetical protein
MRDEFDQYLCKTYPALFADRDKPMQVTAMCWGFSHGDGWFNIINNLCSNIQHHIDWKEKQRLGAIKHNEIASQLKAGNSELFDKSMSSNLNQEYKNKRKQELIEDPLWIVPDAVPQVTVDQVKEKFGTLRFYYSGGDDVIDGMVRMAEAMSAVTCEKCGNVGRRRGAGWISTLCDEHSKEEDYSIGRYVEVGHTVSIFTKDGFNEASVVNIIDEDQGIIEVLDNKNATITVKPVLIGGVDLGSYEPVTN